MSTESKTDGSVGLTEEELALFSFPEAFGTASRHYRSHTPRMATRSRFTFLVPLGGVPPVPSG